MATPEAPDAAPAGTDQPDPPAPSTGGVDSPESPTRPDPAEPAEPDVAEDSAEPDIAVDSAEPDVAEDSADLPETGEQPVDAAPGGEADEQPAAAHEADDDEPGPALEAVALSAGGSTPLDLVARPGELTLWPGDDSRGTAELALALSGRFRPVTGTVRLLGRETTPALLRRQVVPARVEEAIEAEPRLTVGEYLASCAVLHGSRHNRLDGPQALADVGYQGAATVPIDELGPADAVRVAVAGALLARPVAVIVDRVDRGVGADDWPGLVADLHRAAELSGVALIASLIRAMEVDR